MSDLPVSASVGSMGPGASSNSYTNATKATLTGTSVTNWSLNPDTASTAWLCADSSSKTVSGTSTGTGSECYKIDTSGNILGAKMVLNVSGIGALTFQ